MVALLDTSVLPGASTGADSPDSVWRIRASHIWKLDFGPSDLIFDPAHDLMFAGAGEGSKIAMLRIREGDVLAEHATGDPGRKFGMGIGATLYVLNPYTKDVSIFDVAKQDVVDIVYTGGGTSRFVQLPGDPTFWVQAARKMVHFDTTTKRIDRKIEAPQGYSYNKVLVFDLRTGEAVGQADVPRPADALWIDNAQKP